MDPAGPNPLKELLLDEGATLMPYGVEPPEPGTVRRAPADSGAGGGAGSGEGSTDVPLLAVAFGPIELEYASLRKDCVIIDRPDRAVIEVSGYDAREFLGRMLTSDVAALKPRECCNSFWLNRKGRIDADLRVIRNWDSLSRKRSDGVAAQSFLLELERGSLDATMRSLGSYVISEEVTLTARPDFHRISLHGPRAHDLLVAIHGEPWYGSPDEIDPDRFSDLEAPNGHDSFVDRRDACGVPGFELFVDRAVAPAVYEMLLRRGRPEFLKASVDGADPGVRGEALAASRSSVARSVPSTTDLPPPESIRLRPCGWFAYNIARIEAGTPLFKIDFGPENLPAETGVLDDRVNFKKGCYLGQEVVARMHARGHPKQRLVALRFDDDLPAGPDGLPPLPVQGNRVLAMAAAPSDAPREPAPVPDAASAPHADAKPIGSITSSTFSPMLGRVPIAFAMLAWSQIAPGTRVLVETESGPIGATVQQGLRFVP